MYHIGGNTYTLVLDHKNGWNYEVFRDRYSEVLDRYDFIVGDWGYNQLRLKGFFKEANNKGSKEASISLLHDYLNEYCNFGCAYFIIEKLASRKNLENRGEGDDPEFDEDRLYEGEKPREYELKPRHQYQPRKPEPDSRHRSGQDKTAVVHALPDSRMKPSGEGGRRDGERSGFRGQDNRPRNQDGARGSRDQGNGKPRGEQENGRHRDSGGGGRPRDRENGVREGENGRQKDQEGRRREQHHDARSPKDQQNRSGREQQGQPGKQQGQPPQGEKGKNHPPRNKSGGEHHRIRDKDREKRQDREKGGIKPLV